MRAWRPHAVACLTRLYPLASGCANLANHGWVQRLAGSPSGRSWARVPGGEVLASLDDYVGRAAFYVGDLDRKLTMVCRRLLRPGDTVLDIGANIGLVSLLASRLVGPQGRVHAFEPNPKMQDALTQMIQRNALGNVALHRFALGEQDGELELTIPQGNAGAASLVRTYGNLPSEHCKVPVHRLDDVLERVGLDAMRLVKIDVEGFEPEVFRGAPRLLSNQRADAILFEFNERGGGQPAEQPIFQLLMDAGYRFLAIPKSLFGVHARRFDVAGGEALPGHDVVACPAGERYEDIAARLGA